MLIEVDNSLLESASPYIPYLMRTARIDAGLNKHPSVPVAPTSRLPQCFHAAVWIIPPQFLFDSATVQSFTRMQILSLALTRSIFLVSAKSGRLLVDENLIDSYKLSVNTSLPHHNNGFVGGAYS